MRERKTGCAVVVCMQCGQLLGQTWHEKEIRGIWERLGAPAYSKIDKQEFIKWYVLHRQQQAIIWVLEKLSEASDDADTKALYRETHAHHDAEVGETLVEFVELIERIIAGEHIEHLVVDECREGMYALYCLAQSSEKRKDCVADDLGKDLARACCQLILGLCTVR